MPSPFPGMNPYLEHRAFWSSFHTRLMVAIADTVAPQLRPNYYIEVETRTYQDQEEPEEILVGIPDAAVLAARSTDRVEPLIELQAIVQGVCDRAGYNERIDYSQPVP